MARRPPEITVSIPALPRYVHVLRAVVASVAARLDWAFDEIEDLRLMVDEACSRLVGPEGGAATLRLRVLVDDGGLTIEASTDRSVDRWPPEDPGQTLSRQILSTLADEVRFEPVDGRPSVLLRKHRDR
ncbi:MAG TPA: ATP-binding protein [Actinomycetota bacterium]|nr:ATP-binding protein [Actinomycetota bacterium]